MKIHVQDSVPRIRHSVCIASSIWKRSNLKKMLYFWVVKPRFTCTARTIPYAGVICEKV